MQPVYRITDAKELVLHCRGERISAYGFPGTLIPNDKATKFAQNNALTHSLTHSRTHSLTHSRTHSLTHSRTLPTSLSRLEHKPSINRLHSTLSLVLAYASANVRPNSSSFFITVFLRVFFGRLSFSQVESIWWQLWVSCHWAFVGYDQAIAASGFELYLLRNSCLQNRLGS